jgi:hypothetical protein
MREIDKHNHSSKNLLLLSDWKTIIIFSSLWRFGGLYLCHNNISFFFYLLNSIKQWTNATGVTGRYQSHLLHFIIFMYKRLIACEKKELKTMVHKNQFFYLFVSRRTEEVYTHRLLTYTYIHTLTHIRIFTLIKLDFHCRLFKQNEWAQNSVDVIVYKKRIRIAHLMARQHVTMDEQTWNLCCVIHSKVYANLCTWAYV